MRTLTLKPYVLNGVGERPPVDHWTPGFRVVPIDLLENGDLKQQLAKLGFDVNSAENVHVGYLTASWGDHPRLALAVAKCNNPQDGDEIVVSLEKAPPSPIGDYFGDPMLIELAEAVRRRREK
jgi:hypothetical protein